MVSVAVPAPITWVDGVVYTDTDYNTQIRDAVGFLLNPPMFYGQCTTAATLTSSAWTPIPINVEKINTEGASMHSIVTNNTRVTITHEGWWDLIGQGSWAPSSAGTTGQRRTAFRKNGSATDELRTRRDGEASTGTTTQWVKAPIKATAYLIVGDYVELVQYHDAGAGTHTTWNNVDAYPFLAMKWRSKT